VSVEPLYPAGDIDDYVFELTEETTVDILWEVPPAANAVWGLLFAEKSSDTAVWAGFATNDGPQVHRVVLPPDRYRFSVMSPNARFGGGQSGPMAATLPYRFAVVRRSPP
jgi:hypothetical protein